MLYKYGVDTRPFSMVLAFSVLQRSTLPTDVRTYVLCLYYERRMSTASFFVFLK